MSTRKRDFPGPRIPGSYLRQVTRRVDTGQILSTVIDRGSPQSFLNLKGNQVTDSENHPGWRRVNTRSGDMGGPFYTQKKSVVSIDTGQHNLYGSRMVDNTLFSHFYAGCVFPYHPAAISFPTTSASSDTVLGGKGSEAIARCKPRMPVENLAATLIELKREGLPNLLSSVSWQGRTDALRKAGSGYLDLEFGWKPLIGEVSDVANALLSARAALRQYERDAGRVVRRRLVFPQEASIESTLMGANRTAVLIAPEGGELYKPIGQRTGSVFRIRRTIRDVWFSGAFTYHLPADYNSRVELDSLASRAEKILSMDLTPEVLWELAPWSWAVDWFSNVGDVISNVTSFAVDGLVLKYGYLMEHKLTEDTYTLVGSTGLQSDFTPAPIVLAFETKKRVRATPFGFGFNWQSLTARQSTILAALGITRRK